MISMANINRIMNNLHKEGPTLEIYFSIPSELEKNLKKQAGSKAVCGN